MIPRIEKTSCVEFGKSQTNTEYHKNKPTEKNEDFQKQLDEAIESLRES